MQSSNIQADIKALEIEKARAEQRYNEAHLRSIKQPQFQTHIDAMEAINKEIYRIEGQIIALQDMLNDKA